MPVYVDSCVVLDVMTDDKRYGEWAESILLRHRSDGLFAHSMVYTEICPGLDRPAEADEIFEELGLELKHSTRFGLWLASRAFVRYRASGGSRTSPLPDFLIGAQAEADGYPLITRDVKRFGTYFPKVKMITP